MSKVILSGYILVAEHELDAVANALKQHIQLTRQEPGCLVFEVNPCPDQPGRFDVYEEFVDKQAFALHQQRVASSNWGKVSANVQRFYKIQKL